MTVRKWTERPAAEDVEAYVRDFVAVLTSGRVEDAEGMVEHAFDDWHENVYNLFQDHYLMHATPPDSSFEGNWWRHNREWLSDVTIENPEWVGQRGTTLWVDVVYQGEPSGYIGEFQVVSTDGEWSVQHNAFRMA